MRAGAFDLGYLSYTLGKLMILKLKEVFWKEQSRLLTEGLSRPVAGRRLPRLWASGAASSLGQGNDPPWFNPVQLFVCT